MDHLKQHFPAEHAQRREANQGEEAKDNIRSLISFIVDYVCEDFRF